MSISPNRFSGASLNSAASRFAVLVVALSVALTACSVVLPDRRPAAVMRTGADVAGSLEAVPGVVKAEVMSGPDGLPGQNEINATLILRPGYATTDGVLLDYILRQLWSQNETHIRTVVSVKVFTGTVSELQAVDLVPPLTALGFTAYDRDPIAVGMLGYQLGTAEITKHYGAWPGPVPALPAALAAH